MPIKRNLLYPIFLNAISSGIKQEDKLLLGSSDTFWKEIVEDLAFGICPTDTYISRGWFCCKLPSKSFSYKFTDKDEGSIFKDIVKLLKENLNLKSTNDKRLIINELENSSKRFIESIRSDWASIKKKSIRDVLFQNFLIDMKIKYQLKDIQVKKIYNFINIGTMLKSIKNTDIDYRDGKIQGINGIKFSHGKAKLDLNIYMGLEECKFDGTIHRLKTTKKLLKKL